ncbi:Uncharacterised protein [uncultured archaeon]|nr:Uncharacterised protein [uncultured archaeon]
MVTQKEVLGKIEKEIKETVEKVAQAQTAFDRDFGGIQEQVDRVDAEIVRQRNLAKQIRIETANAISNNASAYERGETHHVSREVLVTFNQAVALNGWKLQGHEVYNIIHGRYRDVCNQRTAGITKIVDALYEQRSALTTKEYDQAVGNLNSLKSELRYIQQRYDRLSDLSEFRQWAKNHKAREETDARHALFAKGREKASEWAKNNILV